MNVLILGSGGREHALAWKLSQSSLCNRLYIAPGNAGTAMCGDNVAILPGDHEAIGRFVLSHEVDMVVVGPEEPLVKGLGDHFRSDEALSRVLFFGPGASGARLEGSKAFAKAFMEAYGIPTPAYRSFSCEQLEDGLAHIDSLGPPYVLKADGLAAGKGVVICDDRQEARDTLKEMLCEGLFGQASKTVVIEEFLRGRELSAFVITDGKHYVTLPQAKDYKRIGEKDTGANTGGMGTVSPVPFASKGLLEKIERRIIQPTISGLQAEGIPYCGFIFFGLMVKDNDPYVIEYNVRMGDPEAEVILPRISSDLLTLMEAACKGDLEGYHLDISRQYALCVMLASGGYPGEYDKGFEISTVDESPGRKLFYAGVKRSDNKLVTDGGRVMAVTAMDRDLEKARVIAYDMARQIDFKGKYYRRDIGKDLLTYI